MPSPGVPQFDIARVGKPLEVATWAKPEPTYYFMRIHEGDDNHITEFCVTITDRPQSAFSVAPDGSRQLWRSYTEGDIVVFVAPDGYSGGPIGYACDKRLTRLERMPPKMLERYAMRMRVSG